MNASQPEPWLRGPVQGIPPLLQPVAHALLFTNEEIARVATGLTPEELWTMPGGVASVGFHLGHLSGATDRLLTYARGDGLSEKQFAVLASERHLVETRPPLVTLLQRWEETLDQALKQLRETASDQLMQPREVGRGKLPANVIGLLYHVGEHASRHTGQMVTTSMIVRNSNG